jgi:hypothetical protein
VRGKPCCQAVRLSGFRLQASDEQVNENIGAESHEDGRNGDEDVEHDDSQNGRYLHGGLQLEMGRS